HGGPPYVESGATGTEAHPTARLGGHGGPPHLYDVREYGRSTSLCDDVGPRLDARPDDRQYSFSFGAFEGQARRAHPFGAEAALLDRQLDVLHKLDRYVEMEKWGEPAIERARLLPPTT